MSDDDDDEKGLKIAPTGSLIPILEEYKQLFAYANANALTLLKIPPAFLAALGAIVIYKDKLPDLFGLAVSIALFAMLIWVGYCHSMVNGIGIFLIEIEQQINRSQHLSPDTRLSFNSKYISQGSMILPGFQVYSVLSSIPLMAILAGSLYHFWLIMSMWGWSSCLKATMIVLLVTLNLAPLLNMIHAENKTRKKRQSILASVDA